MQECEEEQENQNSWYWKQWKVWQRVKHENEHVNLMTINFSKNSKKRRSSGYDALQYLCGKADNDRTKETGIWTSKTENGNASCTVSTYITTAIAADGNNAAVSTKQTVNTYT